MSIKNCSQHRIGYEHILLLLFVIWMCFGIFPLTCYESDSMYLIGGCEISYHQKWLFPPLMSYDYDTQPLISILVTSIKHLIPLLTSEEIYCSLAALSGFVFLIGCLRFASIIFPKKSKGLILFAAFLLPETYAVTMYPNSAIFAAALFIWAFLFLQKKRFLFALLLLAVAPLCRVDVLIVYPAILPLLYHQGYTFKKSFMISVLYAIGILLITPFLFWVVKANPLQSFFGYQSWNKLVKGSEVLTAIFGYYSLAYLIFIPIGIRTLYKERAYHILFLTLLPIISVHILYRSMGCAAKHYLYITPFAILLGIAALKSILKQVKGRPLQKYALVLILLLFLCGSLSVDIPSLPELNAEYSETKLGPRENFAKADVAGYQFYAGIGAGQLVPTMDEYMIASGHLFYPFYIHRLKEDKIRARQNIQSAIGHAKSPFHIMAFSYEDNILYPNSLLTKGWQYHKDKTRGSEIGSYLLTNGHDSIHVMRYANGEQQTIEKALKELKEENQTGIYYLISSKGRCKYPLEQVYKGQSGLKKINANVYCFFVRPVQ